ncbi:MAG: glycosyltransferase family 2 protein [Terracidiphilus sp.]
MIANVLAVLASILAIAWLWQALAALRGVPTLPDLTRFQPLRTDIEWIDEAASSSSTSDAPDLTVIVPACNEEDSIEATLCSLLASTGLRLQIVAIDDRSTDTTGARMDAIAGEVAAAGGRHELQVIQNYELPVGWLGKTHALALGAERAKAPWLLFTDGDVIFDRRAAALALDFARKEKADHVVLIFTMEFKSIAETAVLAAFHALASWNVRLWKVADPKARDFFGAGGFNLVRRDRDWPGFAGFRARSALWGFSKRMRLQGCVTGWGSLCCFASPLQWTLCCR